MARPAAQYSSANLSAMSRIGKASSRLESVAALDRQLHERDQQGVLVGRDERAPPKGCARMFAMNRTCFFGRRT